MLGVKSRNPAGSRAIQNVQVISPMLRLLNATLSHPRRQEAVNLFHRLTHFMVGNVFTQALAAVTGLFLVRWLSVEQYAIYTIGVATTGAVALLAQGGASAVFVSILGRHWPHYERLSSTLIALSRVRRTVSMFMLPAMLMLAAFLLHQASAGFWSSAAIILALVLFWVGELNSKTVDQVLFFQHQTGRVQAVDSLISVARLALTYALFVIGGLTAATALMVVSILAMVRIIPIERWVYRLIPRATELKHEEDLREIRASVKHQLPAQMFFVLQGQIVLLFLTMHATTEVIAGYGAILRITALMAPVARINAVFCIPIAAKAKRHVGRTILLLTGVNAAPGLALVAIAFAFPSALLWLLGGKYSGLEHELKTAVICMAIMFTGGAFWGLVANRGWVRRASLQIPLGLLWIAIGSYTIDLSTITGALIFNAGFIVPEIIVGIIEFIINLRPSTKS